MKISELEPLLDSMFDCRRPVCLESSPGIGKSEVIEQFAKRRGIGYQLITLSCLKVEDFGIPHFKDGEIVYSTPEWYPCEGSKHGKTGVLFIDERNQGDPSLQKVVATIMQARELHGKKLLEGWQIMSAGNRANDRAGAFKVLGHLRNRETVIEIETDMESWFTWAMQNEIHPSVIAFIKDRPNLLNNYDPKADVNCTPRSLVAVSALMGYPEKSKKTPGKKEYPSISPSAYREVFKGTIGEGAATEFVSFLKIQDKLPDMAELIKDPKKFKPFSDKEVSLWYMFTVNLAYHANEKNLDNICKLVDSLKNDYKVLFFKLLLSKIKNQPKDEQDKIINNKSFDKQFAPVMKLVMG